MNGILALLPLLLAIATGGAIGAVARFRIATAVHLRVGGGFPWGTLAVNVGGSFLLGVVLPLAGVAHPPRPLQAFVMVGVLGAFTTFSTFAFEVVALARDGRGLRALVYAATSLALGLAAIATGVVLGSALA
jgi:fluoride exporter